MKDNVNSKIYVDLDSLLDTRLGTIAKIKGEEVFNWITNMSYYLRVEDKFDGVDEIQFKKLYNERDIETLKLSPATQFCHELGRIALDTVTDSHTQPLRGNVSITVNTFPYQLDEDTCKEIENCVLFYTGEVVAVNAKYIPLQQITPNLLKNEYSLMVMYDYAKWLEIHSYAIQNIPLPEITLLAPRIFFKGRPTEEQLKKENLDEQGCFLGMELLSKPGIGLELIDIKYWCSIPPSPEEKEEQN